MNVKLATALQRELERIYKKDRKLVNRIEKQLALFAENPKHPSLRTHKLSGSLSNVWSISITISIRMIYILVDEETAVFVKMGSHDEVYNK